MASIAIEIFLASWAMEKLRNIFWIDITDLLVCFSSFFKPKALNHVTKIEKQIYYEKYNHRCLRLEDHFIERKIILSRLSFIL